MSITRRIFFGAAASWFSRGVTIVLGLVLLPVLFRHLPKEELGVWLLLGQSWATLGVLDLGLGVTLTRRLAFARGRSSTDPNAALTDDSRAEIDDLMATGHRLYRYLALFVFAVAFGTGFYYLRGLDPQSLSLATVWMAWGVLCLAQALTVWAMPWTCLLQGVGYIGWDALLGSFVNALTLLAQIFAAWSGGGLVELAVIAAVGALLQRVTILGFVRRKRPDLFRASGRFRPDIARSMIPLSLRAWFTALGIVVIHNSDQFFIASYSGAEAIPAYRGAYLVMLNMHMFAGVFASASMPFLAQLWQQQDHVTMRAIVLRNVRLGLLLVVSGVGLVLGLGQVFFDVWLGPGNFVGYPMLVIFGLLFVLEQQSYVLGLSCRAVGDEAFPLWTIAAGALKLGFAFMLMPRLGLLGIAAATLSAQLLTNHWYMVFRAWSRFGITVVDYLLRTLLPCAATFAGVWLLSAWIGESNFEHPWQTVLVAAFAAGSVLLAALWLAVYRPARRASLVQEAVS